MRLPVATPLIKSSPLSQSRLTPALLGDPPAQRAIDVDGATVEFSFFSPPNVPQATDLSVTPPTTAELTWNNVAVEKVSLSGDTVTVDWKSSASAGDVGVRFTYVSETFLQAGYVLGPLPGGVPPFLYSLNVVGNTLTYLRPPGSVAPTTYLATWKLTVSDPST